MEKLDIKWNKPQPLNILSNYYPNEFVIDGVHCASMEGFLQSLKYRDPDEQVRICALTDTTAKAAGKKKKLWKLTGNLYWRGERYKRGSKKFDALRLRAYLALAENPKFIKALEEVKGKPLTHSCGKWGKRRTVLTKREFLRYIDFIRKLKGL